MSVCNKRFSQTDTSSRHDDEPQKTFQPKFASFKYLIPDTTVTVDRKFEILESLEKQNLQNWLCSFKEASDMCKWKDDEAARVFRALVDPSLHFIFEGKRTVDSMVDQLLSYTYPLANYYIYLEELKNIRQEDFEFIRDYYMSINECVKKQDFQNVGQRKKLRKRPTKHL